ncbi:MurR/RpiR family transcriptional regulator [Vagococcus jeotgali]|uniref:MurR/RpiR family transcriptional regulator n=1 Tax=Vagococcus jeotgali TaxID=3109030 RepID=UPI002DD85830|nr:MurR/RpiR family transcriptional regulator [Vagococcus sp. B2T-5]
MDVLLASLSKKRHTLSNLETQVLDFMMEYPELIVDLKVNELSDKLFVSTATITRTAQKLGFNGYQELKYQFSRYLEGSFRQYYTQESKENLLKSELIKSIEDSLVEDNYMKLDQVAELINEASNIEIFAIGGSFSLGLELSKKLLHIGHLSSAKPDWDDLLVTSQQMLITDLAIFISQSGETVRLLDYARILKEKGVRVVSFIANTRSPLESFSDLSIIAKTVPIYSNQADLSSRIGLASLMDVLVIQLIDSVGE